MITPEEVHTIGQTLGINEALAAADYMEMLELALADLFVKSSPSHSPPPSMWT